MTDSPELKDKRVPLVMTASELKAIDDWSFERRIRSRSEAIRQLVALGLKASAEAKKPAEAE
jgi:metal-responsive CopG/Arc/MetJ family transcriptional regulator